MSNERTVSSGDSWDQEEWERVQPLRRHLQFCLVGSLHYAYVDAADLAIKLEAEGRGGEPIEIPSVPMTAAEYSTIDHLLYRDQASAAEVVEAWELKEFVQLVRAGKPLGSNELGWEPDF